MTQIGVKLNKSRHRDVLLVMETATGRPLVIKRYPIQDEAALREYEVLRICKDDPHIVDLLDFYEKDGEWHIVMENVEGHTVEQLLYQQGPLELHTAIDLTIDILTGLRTIHKRGYVHGDLLPSNVIVKNSGEPRTKIIDFQYSVPKQLSGKAQAFRMPAKPHLMLAPETKIGVLDDRYDIYSAGYICACMITGVKLDKRPKANDLDHHAHPLLNVIRKAMHKNPRKRYRSADEMILALRDLQN